MKRIWIETKAGHGQRFCYQTTKKAFNYHLTEDTVPPMNQPHMWNKPKYSTYDRLCLYAISPLTDYVENYTIGKYGATRETLALFVDRFYNRMDDQQRKELAELLKFYGCSHLTLVREDTIQRTT
jgi:uncharacterized protein YeaO (DUF488 family)